MNTMRKLISVIELPEFRNFAKHSLSDEETTSIIDCLASNPEVGIVIQGTGGVRKVRFALHNKGKSGGVRIIYFYHNENIPIFLITGFAKSKMENISKATCNELKKMTDLIIQNYKRKK